MAKTCKYYVEQQLISYDCGVTWWMQDVFRKGDLYETNSRDCGFELIYRWALSENDYECDSVRKYNVEVLQFTTEVGGDYQNVEPVYKRKTGDVVEWLSEDCGYEESTGGFKFSGTSEVSCGHTGRTDENNPSVLYRSEVSGITAPHSIVGDCTEIIGAYAFSETDLQSIDISSYTTEIGNYAFGGCSGLTSMTIPDTVEVVGEGLFSGCRNLTGATLPSGLDYIPSKTFDSTAVENYVVPNGIRLIGSGSFAGGGGWWYDSGRTQDMNITFTTGVTDIGEDAFAGRDFNGTLSLPSSLKYIGYEAFRSCIFGDELEIPNGVEHISSDFITLDYPDTTGLGQNLSIPGSVKLAQLPYMFNYGFSEPNSENCITGITFHEGTEAIASPCGGYGYHPPFFNIPDSVSILLEERGGFIPYPINGYDDNYKGEYIIPSGVSVINGDYVRGANSVASDGLGPTTFESAIPPVVVGEVNPTIYNRYDIFVPDNSVEIYKTMWSSVADRIKPVSSKKYILELSYNDGKPGSSYLCYLSSIPISSGDTTISGITIGDCANLIPSSCFRDCYNVTSLNINNGITTIDDNAFYNCTGLTSVTIPSSVRSIGIGAFDHCTSLGNVYIERTGSTSVYSTSFPSGCTIHVPCEAYGYWYQAYEIDYPEAGVSVEISGSSACVETQWVESGTTCVGYDKYSRYVEQFRCISTDVWRNTGNESAATLIEVDSLDCGYVPADYRVKVEYGDGTQMASECETTGSQVTRSELTAFPDSAFTKCWLGDCVTSLGNNLFYNYYSVQEVHLPSRVSSIPSSNFNGATGLTTINLDNITSIKYRAFKNCRSLSAITIPATMEYIEAEAFYKCYGLQSITCLGTTPPQLRMFGLAKEWFDMSTCPIYVPSSAVETYKTAQYWSEYSDRIQAIQS